MLHKAKYLAAASIVEYAVQLVLPVLLARTLAAHDFASYRFLWLVAGTVTGVLMLGLPQSLFYFLPRRDAGGRATVLVQTIAMCSLLGAAGALAVLALARAPWTAAGFALLPPTLAAVALFIVLLAGTMPYEHVAAALKDIEAQARINLATTLTRVVAVLAGAWIGTLEAIVWALVAFAAARFAMQALFVARRVPLGEAAVRRASLREQIGYALPFGLATGFWLLRGQAEQWVGAAMLSARDYASLSVAGALLPAVLLVRNAITQSTLAEVNRLEAEARHAEMLRLNADSNLLAASIVFPLLALLFALASPLIVLVYTPTYASAALVMQLLVVGSLGSNFVETSSLAKALNLGRRLMMFDAAMLFVAVALSIGGGLAWGMPGIVLGSVAGRYLSGWFCASIVWRALRVPLRDFQAWRPLLKILLASALAAAVGALVVQRGEVALPTAKLLLRLAEGGLAVLLSYAAAIKLLGEPLLRRPPRPAPEAPPLAPPFAPDTIV